MLDIDKCKNILKKIDDSIWYKLAVFTIIMPINGIIIKNGFPIIGLILIVCQIPTLLRWVYQKTP